jgi:ATP-binding cassette subfamily F protein uup
LTAAEAKRQNMLRRELEWIRRGAQARSTKQKARKQRFEILQQLSYDRGSQQVAIALANRRLGQSLFQALDFFLEPGDRLGITGPNGTGKSTFLDILAGKLAPDTGRIDWGETVELGYYDQQGRGLDESLRVIDFITQKARLIKTKDGEVISAAQMLEWFLFPGPQQYARISTLSGGERRRLYLLYILIHQPNVLFLDEPTNDLDLQTLTVLEEFLDHFQGSLVVISHDRYFLDRTTDYLISFENGAVSPRYPTPFATFQRLYRKAQQGQVKTDPSPSPAFRDKQPQAIRPRRLSYKERQELMGLETRIDSLETRKKELQEEINRSGSDYQRLQDLSDHLQAIEVELEASMERWLELEEVAG